MSTSLCRTAASSPGRQPADRPRVVEAALHDAPDVLEMVAPK